MPTILKQLLLQFILIALNAFFAATEIAVISLNSQKMRALADDGDKKAGKIAKILDDPTKFLSTIQVGITLAGFLGSAFAADSFGEMLALKLAKNGANIELIKTLSVIIVTIILSYFTLVLGELVPKRIAMKNKEKVAKTFCGVVSVLTTILKPVIWFLTVSTGDRDNDPSGGSRCMGQQRPFQYVEGHGHCGCIFCFSDAAFKLYNGEYIHMALFCSFYPYRYCGKFSWCVDHTGSAAVSAG